MGTSADTTLSTTRILERHERRSRTDTESWDRSAVIENMQSQSSSMVEKSDLVALFPTFVFRTQLKPVDFARINRDVADKLAALIAKSGPRIDASRWQTQQRLHELAEFEELSAIVVEAAHGVLEWQKVLHSGIRITGCWANISAPGATHRSHNHPNNYLSAVYYVSAPEGARHIVFEDPRAQTNVISPRVSELSERNAGQILLGVTEGLLVMFPAWLNHSVPENRSGADRISIAFNLMFDHFAEDMAMPKWEGNLAADAN